MMALPKIHLLKDSNEQFPLQFPETMYVTGLDGERKLYAVEVTKMRLVFGDYAIKDWEHLACVERKGSIEELRKNLFDRKDKKRAKKAFDKLEDGTKFKYLLADFTPANFYATNPNLLWCDVVQDAFIRELQKRNIQLIWLPRLADASNRRQIGEIIVRILYNHVLTETARLLNEGKEG